ncbi:hypothetical protein [Xanthovirga aplysinae]|uniref:hypothetical protein n=1 Tax=Xanthovirga aplysinae TaxID=2529853 RepID=UPI0012BBA552|nr:hypothetical protein [Xanthovirga aplysinae]MTI29566.1 hypothetical protein [Xanthovirga aplysinae]
MIKSKTLLIVAFLLLGATFVQAQDYKTGLGVRLGPSSGVTVKHFMTPDIALEGILDTRSQGFLLTGLYEIQAPAFNEPGFSWFYGLGGHIGVWGDSGNYPWIDEDEFHDGSYLALGVDGIIGIEYTFSEAPINIGLNWKPALNLYRSVDVWGDGVGLTLRYAFKN